MSYICGIYGFQITQPIELNGLRIKPRTSNHQQAESWAKNLNGYHLTAVLKGDSISEEQIFNLAAILTFVENIDVLITSPEVQTSDDPFNQLTQSIMTRRGSNGGASVIGADTLFKASRSVFIARALDRLQNVKFCESTQFNVLFFKCVEAIRLQRPFVEILYFLLYSGLESYARSVENDRTNSNSSEPICKSLKKMGFDVHQGLRSTGDNRRAVAAYTSLRNTLFHNSEFAAITKNDKGIDVELRLTDYLGNITRLVELVILKAVEFDDEHINWNSWIDRMQFK